MDSGVDEVPEPQTDLHRLKSIHMAFGGQKVEKSGISPPTDNIIMQSKKHMGVLKQILLKFRWNSSSSSECGIEFA